MSSKTGANGGRGNADMLCTPIPGGGELQFGSTREMAYSRVLGRLSCESMKCNKNARSCYSARHGGIA